MVLDPQTECLSLLPLHLFPKDSGLFSLLTSLQLSALFDYPKKTCLVQHHQEAGRITTQKLPTSTPFLLLGSEDFEFQTLRMHRGQNSFELSLLSLFSRQSKGHIYYKALIYIKAADLLLLVHKNHEFLLHYLPVVLFKCHNYALIAGLCDRCCI